MSSGQLLHTYLSFDWTALRFLDRPPTAIASVNFRTTSAASLVALSPGEFNLFQPNCYCVSS